uniref:Uncharacterized protein n=1 Tax=Setaria italica TaxID=4555 RepID=K3ZKY2_SETIT
MDRASLTMLLAVIIFIEPSAIMSSILILALMIMVASAPDPGLLGKEPPSPVQNSEA